MDAIAQNVNVISMSLGGGGCDMSGNDTDPVEGQAIAAAIAAKIVVVAASGNNGPTPVAVTAPGCDTGVIAAGATSLDDGTPTGTSQANGYSSTLTSTATAANPVEYVAYYSQYGTATGVHSSSAWGIVAPGGDPSSIDISGTADDLHWIENIWTTTPFGGQSDTNFAGECTPDFGTTSQNDCRTLIAGTSMATPHVAGAAALIIAATGGLTSSYQSPTAMKALLCATADDISDSHQGCGRLNVYNAMGLALNDPARATPIP
jgi:subtilisin family serine protease